MIIKLMLCLFFISLCPELMPATTKEYAKKQCDDTEQLATCMDIIGESSSPVSSRTRSEYTVRKPRVVRETSELLIEKKRPMASDPVIVDKPERVFHPVESVEQSVTTSEGGLGYE